MAIEHANYTDDGSIFVVINGSGVYVPDDMMNSDRQALAEWEAAGGIIEPYMVPQPDLLAHAAQMRWRIEVGGTVWNGWPVHTDRESQGKIVAEVLAIERGERHDGGVWKFADGAFRALTNADMEALALAVRNHVRTAFAAEAQVLAQIEAGSITTVAEVEAAFLSLAA